MNSYYIAVSGNVGSGKSTISKLISKHFHFQYIPHRRLEYNFLENFFKNPIQWFLPTQLSFIINKSSEIADLINSRENIVLDRSIYEDVNVFAKLWTEHYPIDSNIVSLYMETANYLISSLKKPDLIILCKSSSETCKKRIEDRGKRNFEEYYPKNHIDLLDQYYKDWISSFNDVPVIVVDTDNVNLNEDIIAQKFLAELTYLITLDYMPKQYKQISIWEDNYDEEATRVKWDFDIIQILNPEKFFIKKYLNPKNLNILKKPKVYIAAPFTAFANKSRENTLLDALSEYDLIDDNYKKNLLKVERFLKNLGLDTFLPHRDINLWGDIHLSAGEVLNSALSQVSNCDIIFAIPSNSTGVHLELGIAISQNKPLIVIDLEEIETGFFVQSFKDYSKEYHIKAKNFKSIFKELQKDSLKEFLNKNLDMGV